MKSQRKKMIEREAREIIGRFIVEELPDNDNIFGIINISDVVLSSDGSYLDVFVSVFQKKDELTKTLAKHAYIIQRHIGKKLGMRLNPRVRFRYDNSGEVGQTVTHEINKLDLNKMEKNFEENVEK